MRGAISPIPQYVFMARCLITETTLSLPALPQGKEPPLLLERDWVDTRASTDVAAKIEITASHSQSLY